MTVAARTLVLSAMAAGGVLVAVGTLLGWWLFETTRPPATLTVIRAPQEPARVAPKDQSRVVHEDAVEWP